MRACTSLCLNLRTGQLLIFVKVMGFNKLTKTKTKVFGEESLIFFLVLDHLSYVNRLL